MASPRSTPGVDYTEKPSDGISTLSNSPTAGRDTGGETTSLDDGIQNDIQEVARRYSSTLSDEHAFKPRSGGQLDPSSPHFDSRAWVKALVRLNESDPDTAPPRSLGVAFRNLSVHGWGTGGAEYQRGVLDLPWDVVRGLARMLVPNRRGKKVEILRGFEGVVEEGELLLVLGPPGSGSSTLLKTIAGETAGLEVDEESYMNFRGTYPPLVTTAL